MAQPQLIPWQALQQHSKEKETLKQRTDNRYSKRGLCPVVDFLRLKVYTNMKFKFIEWHLNVISWTGKNLQFTFKPFDVDGMNTPISTTD